MTNGKGKSNPESAWSEDKAMLDHIEREEQKSGANIGGRW